MSDMLHCFQPNKRHRFNYSYFSYNPQTSCVLLFGTFEERNDRVFRGSERRHSEIWCLVKYHVPLWASISKIFYNYSLGNILLSWSPFFNGVVLLS